MHRHVRVSVKVRHFWQICHTAALSTFKIKRSLGQRRKWGLLARALVHNCSCTLLLLGYDWYPMLFLIFADPASKCIVDRSPSLSAISMFYLNMSVHPPFSLIWFRLQPIWSTGFRLSATPWPPTFAALQGLGPQNGVSLNDVKWGYDFPNFSGELRP